ncbi:hypothetical protein [Desulfurobacterium crinifex]
MKIENTFIAELIESKDPVSIIGGKLLEIWFSTSNKENSIEDYYYKGEEEAKDFEEFILKAYWEFYDLLAKACLNRKNVFQMYKDEVIVVMDGMSLRESILLHRKLEIEGYKVKHSLNLSALPSDTEIFREKIGKSISEFLNINNPENIRLSGDEKLIWSYFPDVMLDKIKVGQTVISSLKEMYKTTEKIILEILRKVKTKKLIITSDHGYLRTEAGFIFSVQDIVKKKLQKTFGGKRFIRMDEIEVDGDLEREGYIKGFNGYYVVKSRYSWPVSGKYSIYIHGGLSLMECFVPVLEVEKWG